MAYLGIQPGYGFSRIIGSSTYLFSVGTADTAGYLYTNLPGCSCYAIDYLDVTGISYDYWITLGAEHTPTITSSS